MTEQRIRRLRPVTDDATKYTEWTPEFERAVVYACAYFSRFWGLIGTHLDTDALRDQRGVEIVKVCGEIARETGTGPTSPLLVLRRLQAKVEAGSLTAADLDTIASLFDEVEDHAIPNADQLAAEAALTLKQRERDKLIAAATLASSKGKSLARYAGQIQAIEKIGEEGATGSVNLGPHVWSGIEAMKRSSKLPLGIALLDDALGGGIKPKTLTTIGADQGVGKTALMVHCACFNFMAGKRIIYIPTEEDVPSTLVRVISWVTGMPMDEVERTSPESKARFASVLSSSGVGAFALEYLPQGAPVSAVRQVIEQALEDHPEFGGGFDACFVDYGDKLGGNGRERNRYEELGTIWTGLRQIAVDFDNWMVTGSQLKDREGKKQPQSTDLRGSRLKGDESDAVILIDRPSDAPDDRVYIIGKHRGPGAGQVIGPIPTELDIGRIAPCGAQDILTAPSTL